MVRGKQIVIEDIIEIGGKKQIRKRLRNDREEVIKQREEVVEEVLDNTVPRCYGKGNGSEACRKFCPFQEGCK